MLSHETLTVDPDAMRANEADFRKFVDTLFCEKRDGIDGLLHAAVGLAGEAGEVLDLVKKSWVYGKPLNRAKLMEEMGDVLHYYFMVMIKMSEDTGGAEDCYVNLAYFMLDNIRKLNKRYPNGFSKADAIARADVGPVRPAGPDKFDPEAFHRGG